jgi:hypothetical protein
LEQRIKPAIHKTVEINKIEDSVFKKLNPVGLGVLAVKSMKSATFWNVTPGGRP